MPRSAHRALLSSFLHPPQPRAAVSLKGYMYQEGEFPLRGAFLENGAPKRA